MEALALAKELGTILPATGLVPKCARATAFDHQIIIADLPAQSLVEIVVPVRKNWDGTPWSASP